jgi:hypothetical protein
VSSSSSGILLFCQIALPRSKTGHIYQYQLWNLTFALQAMKILARFTQLIAQWAYIWRDITTKTTKSNDKALENISFEFGKHGGGLSSPMKLWGFSFQPRSTRGGPYCQIQVVWRSIFMLLEDRFHYSLVLHCIHQLSKIHICIFKHFTEQLVLYTIVEQTVSKDSLSLYTETPL